jgi:hypothetical protein
MFKRDNGDDAPIWVQLLVVLAVMGLIFIYLINKGD